MASTGRARAQAYPAVQKSAPAQPSDVREKPARDTESVKRELLDDLMSDAKKCFATKSKLERDAIVLAIKEIAAN